jgi:2-polyprenyl-3-methyl-5-hydroxy-6-metoxy-1,4-benzoquinol methylase
MAWLERGRRKRFAGDLFQRFEGLDPVLEQCAGAEIPDIGSCDGLVAYEFARRGAALIHGFEIDAGDVAFAQRLFRDVPGKSAFVCANVAADAPRFREQHANVLRESYDIVLFLGVYHHFERQMDREALAAFVKLLIGMARNTFVVRTKQLEAVEPWLLEAGFQRTSETAGQEDIGALRIYERAA